MSPSASDLPSPPSAEPQAGTTDPSPNGDRHPFARPAGGASVSELDGPVPVRPVRLSRRVPPSAVGTLLKITAERQLRGRRLWVLCLLFSLPVLLAVLTQRFQEPYRASEVETILIF